jgi:hypothetical protein
VKAFAWSVSWGWGFCAAVVLTVAGALFLSGACGSGGNYERLPGGPGGDSGLGGDGTGGLGSGGSIGTGGTMVGSGGTGMGGSAAVGGTNGGGVGGAAGSGTAGAPAGGAAGHVSASGGAAGGSIGTGGVVSTGGVGTGGVGTGGAGTGGAVGGSAGGRGGATGGGGMTSSGGATGGGGAAGGAGGAAASQKIISIDFVGGVVSGGSITTMTPMAATEVAGVKPAANWNSAAGNASATALTPLVAADGSAVTGSSITWSAASATGSPGVYSAGLTDMPGNARMMNGYLDPASGALPSATIAVSGLGSLTGGYDVYVYFLAALSTGQTRTHTLAIGSTSVTVSQTGPTAFTTFSPATSGGTTGNYVVFKQVMGASFTLTSTAVSGATKRAPVNGIQIVWPSGS